MTHQLAIPRSQRSVALALLTALCLLAAMLVAAPQAVGADTGPTIMEIQGDGHLSPLVGDEVTTEGVVTAVGFRSFYVQDVVGDGDDTTSDGIFVSSTSAVAVGDVHVSLGGEGQICREIEGAGRLRDRPVIVVPNSGWAGLTSAPQRQQEFPFRIVFPHRVPLVVGEKHAVVRTDPDAVRAADLPFPPNCSDSCPHDRTRSADAHRD